MPKMLLGFELHSVLTGRPICCAVSGSSSAQGRAPVLATGGTSEQPAGAGLSGGGGGAGGSGGDIGVESAAHVAQQCSDNNEDVETRGSHAGGPERYGFSSSTLHPHNRTAGICATYWATNGTALAQSAAGRKLGPPAKNVGVSAHPSAVWKVEPTMSSSSTPMRATCGISPSGAHTTVRKSSENFVQSLCTGTMRCSITSDCAGWLLSP